MSPALKRKPRLTLKHNNGLLNRAAVNILTHGGETHVIVVKKPNGDVVLEPFKHEGMLGVAKVHDFKLKNHGGQSRVALGCLVGVIPDGDYEVVWDDQKQEAVLKEMNGVSKGEQSQASVETLVPQAV